MSILLRFLMFGFFNGLLWNITQLKMAMNFNAEERMLQKDEGQSIMASLGQSILLLYIVSLMGKILFLEDRR